MSKKIAFFDFDGTITTKDTLLEFIKFSKGNAAFYLGFLLHLHYLFAFKFKLISNQLAKEKILIHFFKGYPVEEFKQLCIRFHNKKLPQLIRPKAIEEIKKLQKEDFIITIVSASPENWINPWASQMNVELIASKMDVVDGKITGKICGKNCHGDEKVRRIKELYPLEDFTQVYVYGDSSGDKPMLKLATSGFYKPFRKEI